MPPTTSPIPARLVTLGVLLALSLLACGVDLDQQQLDELGTVVAATLTAMPAPTQAPTESATNTIPAPAEEPPTPSATPAGEVVYDFTSHVCEAAWSNNAFTIPCPSDGAAVGSGYVGLLDNPTIEGGVTLAGRVLHTQPALLPNVGIFGTYPSFQVQSGDSFRVTSACLNGPMPAPMPPAEACNVEFALEYYDANGDYHTYSAWDEVYDGLSTDVVVDLTSLAGQVVRFVLVVRDNGDAQGDYPVWIEPHIWREASP